MTLRAATRRCLKGVHTSCRARLWVREDCREAAKPVPRHGAAFSRQDFVRRVCKPMYTEVFKDDRDPSNILGVVEFETKEDMRATQRKVRPPPTAAGPHGGTSALPRCAVSRPCDVRAEVRPRGSMAAVCALLAAGRHGVQQPLRQGPLRAPGGGPVRPRPQPQVRRPYSPSPWGWQGAAWRRV